VLVQTNAGRALASFADGSGETDRGSWQGERRVASHLFRAHRRAFAAVNSGVAETVRRFVSWRRRNGRPGQTRLPRRDATNARIGPAGSCALGVVRPRPY